MHLRPAFGYGASIKTPSTKRQNYVYRHYLVRIKINKVIKVAFNACMIVTK